MRVFVRSVARVFVLFVVRACVRVRMCVVVCVCVRVCVCLSV